MIVTTHDDDTVVIQSVTIEGDKKQKGVQIQVCTPVNNLVVQSEEETKEVPMKLALTMKEAKSLYRGLGFFLGVTGD